jgi:hypothetical protein
MGVFWLFFGLFSSPSGWFYILMFVLGANPVVATVLRDKLGSMHCAHARGEVLWGIKFTEQRS